MIVLSAMMVLSDSFEIECFSDSLDGFSEDDDFFFSTFSTTSALPNSAVYRSLLWSIRSFLRASVGVVPLRSGVGDERSWPLPLMAAELKF